MTGEGFSRLVMGSHQSQAVGFPDRINRKGQTAEMVELPAGEPNIFQLMIIEQMEFREFLLAAPVSHDLPDASKAESA